MSTYGVTYTFNSPSPVSGLHNKLDLVHDILTGYNAFYSVDITSDSESTFSILFGIDVPDGFDAESFAVGVVEDALTKALAETSLASFVLEESEERVSAFA